MLQIVNFFFKSSWKVIVLTSVVSGITAAFNLLVIRYITNMITDESSVNIWSVVLIIGLTIVSSLISIYLGKYVTKYYSMRVIEFRKSLSEEVIKGNFQNNEMKLGNFVSVLLYEVSTIGNFGRSISGVLSAFFQLVVVLGYLFFLSWQLTILIILVFALMNSLNYRILPMIRSMENELSKMRYNLYSSLVRFVDGFKDLSVHSKHAQKYIDNSVDLPSKTLALRELDVYMLKSKNDAFKQIIAMSGITIAIVIFISHYRAEQELLFKYLTLVLFIVPSASTLFGFMRDVKSVENAMDQVAEYDIHIMKENFEKDRPISIDNETQEPLISLRNVEFSYQSKSNFRLGPVSFDIMRNQIIIINGSNGSGKSTLFRIMVGLFWPDKGDVCFQGEPLTKEVIQSYRDLFGCYFTDTPVFDDLTYLDKEMIDKYGDEFIEKLQLTGKLKFDEIGYGTTPGLSHGQRGRLSLLRLLLQDNEIYFFDEWAANQDFHFKEYFYWELVPELKKQGKTTIIISHDEKFYNIADKVISLKAGEMIETYL